MIQSGRLAAVFFDLNACLLVGCLVDVRLITPLV